MLIKKLLLESPRVFTPHIVSRNLSKSNQRPNTEYKHYRLWSLPGMLVLHKDILAKQHTMYWHPGLNTGIDEQRSIYALRDGIMIITEEEYKPDWDFNLVSKVYSRQDGSQLAPTHMRYIHVIPKRPITEYKLVDLV